MAQQQTDLTVSINRGLKASAEAFSRSYGFTMSTGIIALLKIEAIDWEVVKARANAVQA